MTFERIFELDFSGAAVEPGEIGPHYLARLAEFVETHGLGKLQIHDQGMLDETEVAGGHLATYACFLERSRGENEEHGSACVIFTFYTNGTAALDFITTCTRLQLARPDFASRLYSRGTWGEILRQILEFFLNEANKKVKEGRAAIEALETAVSRIR